jgi:hypothetical protein
MIKYLNTYTEKDELFKDNEVIGHTLEKDNQFDIWSCTLLKNKNNNKLSIFLEAYDEQWAVINFE